MGLFGTSYNELCRKAIKAIDEGRLDQALNLALKAVSKDATQSRAFFWVGTLYNQAAAEASFAGQIQDQERLLLQAVESFDKAIARETDLEMKAELYWQKSGCVRMLGRNEDAEAATRAADNIMPGFTQGRIQENKDALVEAMQRISSERDAKDTTASKGSG
jgi:tetratricopeptide (TPR) repeat protein